MENLPNIGENQLKSNEDRPQENKAPDAGHRPQIAKNQITSPMPESQQPPGTSEALQPEQP